MICKIVSRLSANKYRVETSTDGKKYTVTNSLSDNLVIGNYVVVTDLCIIAKANTPNFQGTFKI